LLFVQQQSNTHPLLFDAAQLQSSTSPINSTTGTPCGLLAYTAGIHLGLNSGGCTSKELPKLSTCSVGRVVEGAGLLIGLGTAAPNGTGLACIKQSKITTDILNKQSRSEAHVAQCPQATALVCACC
jgi:hypothetical protein